MILLASQLYTNYMLKNSGYMFIYMIKLNNNMPIYYIYNHNINF